MQLTRRSCLATLSTLVCTSLLTPALLLPAEDWRRQHPTLTLGVVTDENELTVPYATNLCGRTSRKSSAWRLSGAQRRTTRVLLKG